MQRESRRKTKEVQNMGTRRLLVPLAMEHAGSVRKVNGKEGSFTCKRWELQSSRGASK